MRTQSPETQLRYLRDELKRLTDRLHKYDRELSERRRHGALLSNICFNLAQDKQIPEHIRKMMDECRKAWDQIAREL